MGGQGAWGHEPPLTFLSVHSWAGSVVSSSSEAIQKEHTFKATMGSGLLPFWETGSSKPTNAPFLSVGQG